MPELPDEGLPAILQSLELRGRPLAAVGKAWRAAVRELRHAVLLVAGEDSLRLRPLYPPGGVLVTEVASGSGHTLVVTAAGLLFGRGRNHYGQLGLEASVTEVGTLRPVPLPKLRWLPAPRWRMTRCGTCTRLPRRTSSSNRFR